MLRISQLEAIEKRLNVLDHRVDLRTDHGRSADDVLTEIEGILYVLRVCGVDIAYDGKSGYTIGY
jgi:hypothetical protein